MVYQTVKKLHFYFIDLQRDYFEEISNDDETHRLTGNNGCASEKLYQLCDATVVPEYRDLVRRFMDVPSLAERLRSCTNNQKFGIMWL